MWRQVQVREICIKCIKYIFQNADYRAGLQDDGKRKIRKHPNLASKKNTTSDYSDWETMAFCPKKRS